MSVFANPGNMRSGTAPYVSARQPRARDGRFTSGPAAFGWQGLAAAQETLQQYVDKLGQKRAAAGQRLANDMLAYMRANAPWKDRSGQARNTLMTWVQDNPQANTTMIYLGYGVFYGVFLEEKTYNGVSYAIIRPTLQVFENRLAEYMR